MLIFTISRQLWSFNHHRPMSVWRSPICGVCWLFDHYYYTTPPNSLNDISGRIVVIRGLKDYVYASYMAWYVRAMGFAHGTGELQKRCFDIVSMAAAVGVPYQISCKHHQFFFIEFGQTWQAFCLSSCWEVKLDPWVLRCDIHSLRLMYGASKP